MTKEKIITPKGKKLQLKGTTEWKYKAKKQGWTKEQIEKEAQMISNHLKRKGFNGGIIVDLLYPYHWSPNYETRVGNDVEVHTHEVEYPEEPEPATFQQFRIFAMKNAFKEDEGGNSKHNDCLYDCLLEVTKKKPWKSAETFKRCFGLKRDDKVPLELIPRIEEYYTTLKINVTGDHVYTSNKKAQQVVNLKLLNGHYSIDKAKQLKHYRMVADTEKIPLFLLSKNGKDIVYDPVADKEREITHEQYQLIFYLNTQYILINANRLTSKKGNKGKSLKDFYQEFMRHAKLLKKDSNGKINILKTGNDTNTAIELFYSLYNGEEKPESIRQAEAEWYLKANTGPIMFAEKYEGKGYEYDFTSMYASILASKWLFPYKTGEFKTLKTLPEEKLTYGLYRCHIKPKNPKLFRQAYNDIYTHVDIYEARRQHLKISLIQDGKHNALLYTRDKLMCGSQLFKLFVDILYPIKTKVREKLSKLDEDSEEFAKLKSYGDRVKVILTCLWGVLCEYNQKTKRIGYLKEGKEAWEIPANHKHTGITPISDSINVVSYSDNDDVFKTPFARIKPFLISKGRAMISKVIEPCVDDVKRTHTDSLLVTKKLDYSSENVLGKVRYVGKCKHVVVNNVNNVKGKFTLD